MTRTPAPTHPKLLAVMKPRGTSRGKSRAATVVDEPAFGPAVTTTVEEAEAQSAATVAILAPAPVDATKKAADAFAASHPEGTKALLARLLAEKEQREAGAVAAPVVKASALLTGRASKKRFGAPLTTPVAPAQPTIVATDPEPEGPTAPVTPAGMPEPHANTVSATAVGANPTREAWMQTAVTAMRPWFPDGHVVPEVRISFGWPGGRGSKQGVRGQCWYTTDDTLPAIFIAPDQNDPATVLGIILHEMVHASGQKQHNPGAFGKVAGPMGFLKSFTSSENKTPELAARLAELAEQLGPIDHSRVNNKTGLYGTSAGRAPVQSTRMVKVTCPVDGYTVRATRKWLAIGMPSCPCGAEMVADEGDLDALAPAPGIDNPPPGGWKEGDEL